MNLDFSEEQLIIKTTARDFLEVECPAKLLRELIEGEEVYSPQLWEKIAGAKAELKSLNDAISKNKQELAGHKEYLKKYQNEVKVKEAQIEKELSVRMKQIEVEKKEVEEVAALKAEIIKKGLNLQTLLKLAKEF